MDEAKHLCQAKQVFELGFSTPEKVLSPQCQGMANHTQFVNTQCIHWMLLTGNLYLPFQPEFYHKFPVGLNPSPFGASVSLPVGQKQPCLSDAVKTKEINLSQVFCKWLHECGSVKYKILLTGKKKNF